MYCGLAELREFVKKAIKNLCGRILRFRFLKTAHFSAKDTKLHSWLRTLFCCPRRQLAPRL